MTRIETVLASLREHVDWPDPSEHLASRVVARIESADRSARWRRWAIAAALAILVLVIGLAPAAREAVADLFQEAGVRIGLVDELSSDLGAELELGQQVTLAEGGARVDFELRYPDAMGPPLETYIDEAGLVSMMWEGPVLLGQRSGGVAYAEKTIGSDSTLIDVQVAGMPAVWVAGAGHSFTYLDAHGNRIEETTRLAANVLLWSADGVDHRLELSESLERALEIAESLQGVG